MADVLCTILQKDLACMYPMYMIDRNIGQWMVLPQETGSARPRDPAEREDGGIWRTVVAHRTTYVAEIRVTKLIEGRSGDLLCFLMKAGSVLVPMMAIHCLTVCFVPNTPKYRSGGQSEAKSPVFSFQARLVLIYRPTEGTKS
ncbi:hypothetical protein TNCV_3622381 [Trichonephila clavipes]|nr:hypothetical protein TNCV_3622381 [Trichonephila clavipes]